MLQPLIRLHIEDVQSTWDRTQFLLLVRSADPADRWCDGRTDRYSKGAHNKLYLQLIAMSSKNCVNKKNGINQKNRHAHYLSYIVPKIQIGSFIKK